MNQSDFARLHGVSRKTVTMWKSRGWLIMSGDDIDVVASNAQLEKYRKSVNRPDKQKTSAPEKRKLTGCCLRGSRRKKVTRHWRGLRGISSLKTALSYRWMKRAG